MPVAFALGGIGVVFTLWLWGPQGLMVVPSQAFGSMRTLILIALPLFIFMANMLQRSGVADDLYTAMHRWFGGVNGGLAIGTVVVCTVFAAMSGVSGAATVTMGLIALPQMLARGYDRHLAIGCIMAGGALGPLIPPSVTFVVYGAFAEVSVGRLFAGGAIPGLLLSALFCLYIAIRARIQPRLGPALPRDQRVGLSEKLAASRALVLPMALIIVVLGAIFSGAATPTEAAAFGAFGAIVCAAIYRRLRWSVYGAVGRDTLRTTAMVIFIIIGANVFSSVYSALGSHRLIESVMTGLPGGKWTVLIVMQVAWLILGCLMNSVAILMITGPVFIPLAISLGFDPVWLGVVFMVNMEAAFLTPPFGLNIFYIKGVAPKDVTIEDIYGSVLPFLAIQVFVLVLVMVLPQLALWLPNLIFGRI